LKPLALTSTQLDAVMQTAQPLAPHARAAFLEALAQVLATFTVQ
jgi:hypothetical protein